MISDNEFWACFSDFRKSAFRLETLPAYAVDSEEDVYARFLNGDPEPPEGLWAEWLKSMQEGTDAGKTWTQIHAIEGLNQYLKYEIDWAYVLTSAHGNNVGLIESADPSSAFEGLPYEDFWLFDDELVLKMHYDDEGHFLGATKITEPARVAEYRKARDVALRAAVPLDQYRKTHAAELARRREGATKTDRSTAKESAEAKERPKPAVGGIDF